MDYTSRIEKATGGSAGDNVYGCTGKNVLAGGGNIGGSIDQMADLGGYDQQGIKLPSSSDVYTGFKADSGTMVLDTGGKGDLLNLGAFNSKGVDLYRYDANNDRSANSLLILFDGAFEPDELRGVAVVNQFGSDWPFSFNGKVEKIQFRNKTISPKAGSLDPLPVQNEAAVEALLPGARDAGSDAPLLGLSEE